MLLALRSLEDVYVRGKTVHLVGDGHRFYGNIECESAVAVQVGKVLETAGVLRDDPEWELRLVIFADTDMGRNGRECIHLRFRDRSQAESVREAFAQVAALAQKK